MSLNLSALAVRERSITVFLIFLIAVAGTLAFFQLGRAEDPPFTVKQLTVITAWPGATAQEMQDQVAEPLEKRLQELKWYDRTDTYTRPGLAFTMVSLVDRTPPSQVQEEFYQARKKLQDEALKLPAGVIGPMVNDEFSDVTFALFALKAKGEPQRLLVRDAEALRQRLLHVAGVKKVNIIGEQAERIFVSFSHDRLATLGVSPQDIFAALNSQNLLTPAGSIETNGPQVFLRVDGAFDKLAKIRDTPLAIQGRTLKLSDVATVERGYEDPATFLVRNNGEEALLLGVIMREGWNGLDLGKALDAETARINEGMPLGMTLTKVTDQAVNIDSAVGEFMVKFFVALLVVMLVCFLSMGWRVGVVVAAAVPLTLAIVFVVMAATGKNFDRITLGSLILALGLLVDDAIIAIEMMVVKMEEGYDRIKASAYAWSHTAAPMLSGTLVTAIGFMPNGFAQSTAGEYTSNMFWIVGIALIASWVVAVAFTPYLGVKLLPDIKQVEGGHAAIYNTRHYNRFRQVLTRVIARKWWVAGTVIATFVVAILGMGLVKKQFFPTSDRPEVMVEVQMPYGTSIEQTSAATAKVEAWLQKQDEAKIVTAYIGQGAPRFYLAMAPELPDPSFAKIVVLTENQEARETLKFRLREAAAQGLAPEARIRVTQLVFGPYSPFPVAYRVMGPDPSKLREIAGQVQDVMQASPLMRTVNTDWGPLAPTLHFTLDQDRLQAVGLTSNAVAQQLQFLLTGVPITAVREDIRSVQVVGRAAGDIRLDPARIEGFTLVGAAGQRIPLSQVGEVDVRMEDPILRRRDRTPDHYGTWRHCRRLAATGRLERDHKGTAAGHRDAAERLPDRAGGRHRGVGQGRQGDRAAGADHGGPDAADHHRAGAFDLGNDHGVPHRTAGPDWRGTDPADFPAAVRDQRLGRPDRTLGHPDAQHIDPDRADPSQQTGRAGPVPRGHRSHGTTGPPGPADGAGSDPGLHSADAFGVLGDAGLHTDRRYVRWHHHDAGVPAGDVFHLVQDSS